MTIEEASRAVIDYHDGMNVCGQHMPLACQDHETCKWTEVIDNLRKALPVLAEGPHDHFDSLVEHQNHHVSNPLRSEEDLESAGGNTVLSHWSIDAAMDAAKVTPAWGSLRPDGTIQTAWNIPGTSQLKFPITGNRTPNLSDSIVFTWDWWMTPEYARNCGDITSFKAFQVQLNGDGGWWTLMHYMGPVRNNLFDGVFSPGVGALVGSDIRCAGRNDFPSPLLPNGLMDAEPVIPAGTGTEPYIMNPNKYAFPVNHSEWLRIIVEVKQFQLPEDFTDWNEWYGVTVQPNPYHSEGRWHMISLWYGSESTDFQRVLYRVPMGWPIAYGDNAHVSQWRVEFNSSKTGAIGPMSAYVRNAVTLVGLDADESDTKLFRRPVRAHR
jgi:hypothetical protein